MDSWIWELTIEGIVQGVSLALVLWVAHSIWECRKKHKQKKYIREIISKHVKEIRDAKNIPSPDPDPESNRVLYTAGTIRKSHYALMYKQIEGLLSHKSILINYEDEKLIRDAFYFLNVKYKAHIFESSLGPIPPLEDYEERFIKKLKKIEWLELEKPENPLPFLVSNK